VASPPPAGVRRRIEGNRQKLVGQDKDSLTEQQTKGTVTIAIPIRRIYNIKQENAESNSHRLPPPRAPEQRESTRCPAPPSQNPA